MLSAGRGSRDADRGGHHIGAVLAERDHFGAGDHLVSSSAATSSSTGCMSDSVGPALSWSWIASSTAGWR